MGAIGRGFLIVVQTKKAAGDRRPFRSAMLSKAVVKNEKPRSESG